MWSFCKPPSAALSTNVLWGQHLVSDWTSQGNSEELYWGHCSVVLAVFFFFGLLLCWKVNLHQVMDTLEQGCRISLYFVGFIHPDTDQSPSPCCPLQDASTTRLHSIRQSMTRTCFLSPALVLGWSPKYSPNTVCCLLKSGLFSPLSHRALLEWTFGLWSPSWPRPF